MSLNLLKQNTEILKQVLQTYQTTTDKEKAKTLKNQILFLLTAIKKEVEQEKNA